MSTLGIVLLVEDDIQIQENNRDLLELCGYTVTLAMNLAEAWEHVQKQPPDLIVLDITLPDGNGLDFLKELRQTSKIPVLILTADQTPEKPGESFDKGSDDFLRKPYHFDELKARISALMRRASQVPETVRKGPLTLDIVAMQAVLSGKDLLLTPKEFSVLLLLAQHENEAIDTGMIYEKVWKQPMVGDSQSIRTIISRLNTKLDGSGYDITAPYKGSYRFCSVDTV